MWAMSNTLRHYFNPLHIYCRLRDIGISKSLSLSIIKWYELLIYKHFERSKL